MVACRNAGRKTRGAIRHPSAGLPHCFPPRRPDRSAAGDAGPFRCAPRAHRIGRPRFVNSRRAASPHAARSAHSARSGSPHRAPSRLRHPTTRFSTRACGVAATFSRTARVACLSVPLPASAVGSGTSPKTDAARRRKNATPGCFARGKAGARRQQRRPHNQKSNKASRQQQTLASDVNTNTPCPTLLPLPPEESGILARSASGQLEMPRLRRLLCNSLVQQGGEISIPTPCQYASLRPDPVRQIRRCLPLRSVFSKGGISLFR